MCIQLRTPVTGLFFPSETLPVGSVHSVGGPDGKKLVSQGKAIEVTCPASNDPDDVAALRRKYRKENGPLWDEQKRPVQPPLEPQAVTTIRKIAAVLGNRAASAVRERQNERTSRRREVSKLRVDPRGKAQNALRAVMGSL
jgi:hypothetical protein